MRPQSETQRQAILIALSLGVVPIENWLTTGVIGTVLGYGSFFIALVAILIPCILAYRWNLVNNARFLQVWVGSAIAMAVFSVVTGIGNGLTDEPYSTSLYLHLWPNLYHGTVTETYTQYGTTFKNVTWSFVYLPFMAFYQIPWIDYRYTMVLTWAVTCYLLRKNNYSFLLFSSPMVGIMAANGYNDFVPFLFLTLSLVTLQGYQSRLAEVVSLGLKQFANALLIGYYLITKRWRRAVEAAVITAAIVAPFIYMDPVGFWSNAVLGTCVGHCYNPFTFVFFTRMNYALWPTFILAVFVPKYGMARFKRLLKVFH
jgi:hypothetical protein